VVVDDLALVSTHFETEQNLGPSGIAKRQTGIVVVAGPSWTDDRRSGVDPHLSAIGYVAKGWIAALSRC
jgi:hypothetical protein